jgi:hypothetical protein
LFEWWAFVVGGFIYFGDNNASPTLFVVERLSARVKRRLVLGPAVSGQPPLGGAAVAGIQCKIHKSRQTQK